MFEKMSESEYRDRVIDYADTYYYNTDLRLFGKAPELSKLTAELKEEYTRIIDADDGDGFLEDLTTDELDTFSESVAREIIWKMEH